MNAWRRLVETRMAERGLTVPELARRSGVSRQTVYSILSNEEDRLRDLPSRRTIDALASSDALDLPVDQLLLAAGDAYGIPVQATVVEDLSGVTDIALARELLARAVDRGSDIASVGPIDTPLRLSKIDGRSVTALVELRRTFLSDAQTHSADLPALAQTLLFLADVIESAMNAAAAESD